jgi:microcystin degradation protein MlrC
MRSPEEAIGEARGSILRRLGPVTFVDVDDIVGAGAPGGNTHILGSLVGCGTDLRSYVPVHDPALVADLWDVPLGTRRSVVVRGTPGYGMPQVSFEATVAARTEGDFGRTVRLDHAGIRLVATERPPLPIHPSFWRAVGLEPRQADVVVQKNFFHYRMFYAALSFRHIPVVSDGATSLRRVRERDYAVPMHPKAQLRDWRPSDAALRTPKAAPAKAAWGEAEMRD